MLTINQLRSERFKGIKEIKKAVRSIDTAVEQVQRRIERILARKRDVPTERDLSDIVAESTTILEMVRYLDKVFVDVQDSGIFGPITYGMDIYSN